MEYSDERGVYWNYAGFNMGFPTTDASGIWSCGIYQSYILVHIFDKYIPKEEEHENEDMFMTNREIEAQEEAERTGEAIKDPFAESVAILKGEDNQEEMPKEDGEEESEKENQ